MDYLRFVLVLDQAYAVIQCGCFEGRRFEITLNQRLSYAVSQKCNSKTKSSKHLTQAAYQRLCTF